MLVVSRARRRAGSARPGAPDRVPGARARSGTIGAVSELQRRVDRSTAWVAAASGVLGVLDIAVDASSCLQLWVTTAEFGTATIAAALLPLIDRLGGLALSGAIVREHEPDDARAVVDLLARPRARRSSCSARWSRCGR